MKNFVVILILYIFSCSAISQDLSRFGIDESKDVPEGIDVGVTAPDFKSIDQSDKEFHLYSELKNQPVIVVFYRGYWCPVCNRYLSNLQDSLQYVLNAGAKVVAVTPEGNGGVNNTLQKTGVEFIILSDTDEKIMRNYDVVFTTTKKTRLPVPATYIIDKEKNIRYKHFDYNYRNRATVKAMIKIVESL